jgi:hypothetical protein
MHHVARLAHLLVVGLLGFGTAAFAQEGSPTSPAAEEPPPAPAAGEPAATPAVPESSTLPASAAISTGEALPPSEATSTGEALPPSAATSTGEALPTLAAEAKPGDAGRVGFAARWRFVSVPGWFLGLFSQKNVPLTTFNCWAFEGYWRKRDKDDPNRTWEIVGSVGYQNMSPDDGFWLGKGKQLVQDTDLVQAKGLGLITFDAAYVLRQYFSPYFGIHYGAGLGLGIVRGKVLRTSAACDPVTGQCQVVRSGICGGLNPPCDEQQLKESEGIHNGPTDPHRFEENSVPSAIPIINLLFGLDFPVPLPDKSNLEFRLEAGFYDAFFVGLSAGYVLK